jgi:hypothetical protein
MPDGKMEPYHRATKLTVKQRKQKDTGQPKRKKEGREKKKKRKEKERWQKGEL